MSSKLVRSINVIPTQRRRAMHFRDFEPEARSMAKANHRFLDVDDYDFLRYPENQHHLPQLIWVEDRFISICVGHTLVFLDAKSGPRGVNVSTLRYMGDSGWKEGYVTIYNTLKRLHHFAAIAQNGWRWADFLQK